MSYVKCLKRWALDALDRAIYGQLPEPSPKDLALVRAELDKLGPPCSDDEVRHWTRLALACANGRQDVIRMFEDAPPAKLDYALAGVFQGRV